MINLCESFDNNDYNKCLNLFILFFFHIVIYKNILKHITHTECEKEIHIYIYIFIILPIYLSLRKVLVNFSFNV